jgi:hypothetical protein
MKKTMTFELPTLINQLLDQHKDRRTSAQEAEFTPGQVSAIAAHRTVQKRRFHNAANGIRVASLTERFSSHSEA